MLTNHLPFQRPLALHSTSSPPSFEHYFIGDERQAEIITHMKYAINHPKGIIVHGMKGSGKTHLLKSFALNAHGAIFISGCKSMVSPDAIEETECQWVIIDDCNQYFSHPTWEKALFKRLSQNHTHAKLLLSIQAHTDLMKITLPDLRSRLQTFLSLECPALNDEQLEKALVWLCMKNGFDLNAKTCLWIQTHLSRDPHFLFPLIKKTIEHCASIKQNPSVPLIKKIINEAF